MPGMPATIELSDLAVCEALEGAECSDEGPCEVTCVVGEDGRQRITINGKEMKLDGEAIKLDGAGFTLDGASIEVEGSGAPAEGAHRMRVARLTPEGGDGKTIIVREIKEGAKPKLLVGGKVMQPAGDPKMALEKAEKRIMELKEALKAAEEKLATAGDDRPKLEKELNRLREKLEAAKKHIEALRNQKVKQSEGEKKAVEETKQVLSSRIGASAGG